MEFPDYLALLRRRWWLIAAGLLLSVVGAVVATVHATPQYRAQARLLVSAPAGETAADEIANRQLSSQRAAAYAQYATTQPAILAAVNAAHSSVVPSVQASATDTSPFLTITTTSSNARAAADVANAYVDVLPRVVTQLDQDPSGTNLPRLTVVQPATLPASPFSPRPVKNVLVGVIIGLVLGLGAALLRDALDRTIRRSSEIEPLSDVGLLGVVPKEYTNNQLVVSTRPRSSRAEAYRQVRTALEFSGPQGMPRSLVITSAGPAEGKSTLAANLALVAAHAGKRVVLVDADLRRPSLSGMLSVADKPGLSEVLTGHEDLLDALQPVEGERLTVLASGRLPQSPSELLGSSAMHQVVEELERRFDLVILDSAPVVPVTDALLIAAHVAGVVVVVRPGQTTRSAFRRSVKLLRRVRGQLLGAVANGVVDEVDGSYGYRYGYMNKSESAPEILVPTDNIRSAGQKVTSAPRNQSDTKEFPDIAGSNGSSSNGSSGHRRPGTLSRFGAVMRGQR